MDKNIQNIHAKVIKSHILLIGGRGIEEILLPLSQALKQDENNYYPWVVLSSVLGDDRYKTILATQPQTLLELFPSFPAQSVAKGTIALAAYCCSKALLIDTRLPGLWSNIADFLLLGATFYDLAPELQSKLPKDTNLSTAPTLAIYFIRMALLLRDPFPQHQLANLARALELGAKTTYLSPTAQRLPEDQAKPAQTGSNASTGQAFFPTTPSKSDEETSAENTLKPPPPT